MRSRSLAAALVALASGLGGCWQTSYGIPAYQVVGYALEMMPAALWCRVTGCPAEYPEGMQATIFSDTDLTAAPVAIAVDEWGRVYVGEGGRQDRGAEDNRSHPYWLEDDLASRSVEDRVAYYRKWMERGEVSAAEFDGVDRLLRLEDTDADGAADTVTELARFGELADGIVAGLMVQDGDVWVADVPSLYHLRDPHGGAPGEPEVMATGFGVKTSLIGHDLHGPVQGPDGWLYFSVGDRGYNVRTREGRQLVPPMGPGSGAAFRIRPDGSDLEVFAYGLRNPQDFAFDDFGNLFTVDNNGDGGDAARVVYVVEGGQTGWAMPYQTLVGDYVRGPWVAERLWELQHETQPAWVVPPVAYLSTGPSGLAAYPGLGFPERYRGHFFVADYRYTASQSSVISFAVEPAGAGFEVVDAHPFIGSLLPVDVAFGYDGRFYVSTFTSFDESDRKLRVAEFPEHRADPRVAETVRLVQEGMGERPEAELVGLLAHADRRVRLRAQFELARRGAAAPLARLVGDGDAELVPRLHAVWGLGQLGAEGLRAAGWDSLAWASGAPDELRAQVAKTVGDARADWLANDLVAWLDDGAPRVRFFAAQSLGALGSRVAIEPLFALLRENDDRDVFLRHAASYALFRVGDLDALAARVRDPSRAVRMGALLALRRADDPRIARFLEDPDPLLRVEAARAIYDRNIEGALAELAEQGGVANPFSDEEPQTSHAWHRRVIGAALAVGTPEAARALAVHALDPRNPRSMRELALESLASFTRPAPRDLAMGWWRPQPERPVEVVHSAFDAHGASLVDDPLLGDRALEIAAAYDRLVLPDAELIDIVWDAGERPERRTAALAALSRRRSADPAGVVGAARAALASDDMDLRIAARRELARRAPGEALESIAALGAGAPTAERQDAIALLARVPGEAATAQLEARLAALVVGDLAADEQLDVMRAVEARRDPEQRRRLDAWRESLAALDPVSQRAWALDGGNPERGRAVFESHGDCARCHGAGGHGAGAGPPLEGIAGRRERRHLLESVVAPQAEVVEGYAEIGVVLRDGSVVGGTLVSEDPSGIVLRTPEGERRFRTDEVATRSAPISAMPPIGVTLAPRELRDLIAYLATL